MVTSVGEIRKQVSFLITQKAGCVMKKIVVLFCLVFLMGCSSYQVEEKYSSLPTLLEHVELPPIPQRIIDFRLVIKMLIDENGKVTKAYLLKGSGLHDWDSLAINSIKKWKYEAARLEDKPVSIWLVQKVKVQFESPCCIILSQIVCNSYDTANVVMKKLKEGKDFGELASAYSCDSSKTAKGFIGPKDVYRYTLEICRVLKKLSINEYTQPLEFGKRYVIFKRMKN